MKNRDKGTKTAEVSMYFSEFEVPPMQDVLIIGKRSPIGPEAARRMVDMLSPEQYEVIKIEHKYVEAIVLKKSLINLIPEDKLISIIMEEGGKIADETMIIKAQVSITLHISKSVDL
ncbi:conserved hypothetical protein [Clostridiaceae bacterium BL-3]|nr:conserved hypothetical protein [Clostridiaceae bacterium BL-3]